MSDRTANLKPWPKGVSGNPGGRPKTRPITEELQRLLAEERPDANGQTWATSIAGALLRQASLGDVRAITELANRVEGRPFQAVAIDMDANFDLAERIARARKRVLEGMTKEEIEEKIRQLEQQLLSQQQNPASSEPTG